MKYDTVRGTAFTKSGERNWKESKMEKNKPNEVMNQANYCLDTATRIRERLCNLIVPQNIADIEFQRYSYLNGCSLPQPGWDSSKGQTPGQIKDQIKMLRQELLILSKML